MKPAAFDYARPADLDAACALLADGDDARIIAGGQTLVPLMAMRLARPQRLIDIARIPGLAFVRKAGDEVAIGATTRQCMLERDPTVRADVPLLAAVMPFVGHAAIRARGTIGGSLANADPAAEIALAAVTLGATICYREGAATAEIPAEEFFLGPMTTALPAAGCLTAVRFPVWPERRVGVGFHEVNARKSDFAFASAAAQIALDDSGVCRRLALGIGAVRCRCGSTASAARSQARASTRPACGKRCAPRLPTSSRSPTSMPPPIIAGASQRPSPCAPSPMPLGRPSAEAPMRVELNVNGETRAVEVEPRLSLLDCLRERFLLTGAHAGCEHGVCGACTVLIDGAPARSCLMFAVQADGYAITTIEGVAPGAGELSPVQDAFCETHGMQCGYCTPAMILTAHALLADNPAPSRDEIVEAISGNICRCTGYAQIVEAIALAAERMRGRNRPAGKP